MDEISKFLRKVNSKDRGQLIPVIRSIVLNDLHGLDCKKMKGKVNEYRVRIGKMRIQFVRTLNGNKITDLGFRNDNTY
ncbi:MAG: hypothetical protein Q8R25_01500 [bacterium]|nr:hypothetical protein [bacterium]